MTFRDALQLSVSHGTHLGAVLDHQGGGGGRPAWPWWLTVIAVVVFLAGCTKSAQELAAAAEREVQDGRPDAAAVLLKSALQQTPDNGELRYRLGVLHNEMRDSAAAEAELRRARSLKVILGGRVVAELGRAMILQDDPSKALKDLEPSPAYEAEVVGRIHALRGRAYLQLGRMEEAKRAHDAAMTTAATAPELGYLTALMHVFARDLDAALQSLETVLKEHPRDMDALMLKVDIQTMQRKSKDAVATYAAIVKLSPRFMPVYASRAAFLLTQGDVAGAQKDVDRLMKMAPSFPVAHYLQGMIHVREGRYGAAVAASQQVLKIAPKLPAGLLLSGIAYYHSGAVAQAERFLMQYLTAVPSDEIARRYLAATLVQLNESGRALETLQPLMRQPAVDKHVLALAGDAYLRGGDFNRASELFGKALAVDPENPRFRTGLAMSRLGSGDASQAIEELERAASIGADDLRAKYLLVMTLLREQKHERALAVVKELVSARPKDPVPLDILGVVYLRRGESDRARESFEQALALSPSFFSSVANLARMDLAEKRPDAAKKRFVDALAADQRSGALMMGLARLARDEGRHDEAAQWLSKAVAASPGFAEPRIQLAGYHLRTGNAAKALELAAQAVELSPGNAEALRVLADAQFANGERNNAVASMGRAVVFAPQSADLHFRLGLLKSQLGDIRGAETAMQSALRIRPEFPEAQEGMSRIYAETGRYDDAIKIAAQLKKSYPKAPMGWVLEGDVLAARKQYRQAVQAYDRAFEVQPGAMLVAKTYVALTRAGEAGEAAQRIRRWVEKHPDDVVGRLYMAVIFADSGNLKDAAQLYEGLAKGAPANWVVLNNLAIVYQRMNDPRALETARNAVKLAPESPAVADTLGWLLVSKGDVQEGLGHLRRAASATGDDPSVRYHLAVALNLAGEHEAARAELKRALESAYKFPEIDAAKELLTKLPVARRSDVASRPKR